MQKITVFLLACLSATAHSALYPPGIFPAVCPNYPFCDMEVVNRFTPEGMPKTVPDVLPPGVPIALCPRYPFCDVELLSRYTPEGMPKPLYRTWMMERTEYPAGVPAAACPNYPYCNVGVSSAPLPGYPVRLYPAGVPPAACPGYPYC